MIQRTDSTKTRVTKALRSLLSFVESLDDDQVAALVATGALGGRALPPSTKRAQHVRPAQDANGAPTAGATPDRDVIDALNAATTRDDAERALERDGLRRKDLESVARYLGVHVTKLDTVQQLRTKLVEASVGSKLRSDSIRSLPL